MLDPRATAYLEALGQVNTTFARTYPGDSPRRQPVHTVYGGAQLYRADTTLRLGELARTSMSTYARDPIELASGVGFLPESALDGVDAHDTQRRYERDPDAMRGESAQLWLACKVFERVRDKLQREPVEDFRIDFEDGFGARSDDEEDAVARRAATELAHGLAAEQLPPFVGIRIKSLNEEWKARAARTLDLFFETLLEATGGKLPANFVVTLPKIYVPEQAETLVRLFELIEAQHGLPAQTLQMELMIELTQALLGRNGYSPLPGFLAACEGRCVGAHFGTYDFTASCNITAAFQAMDHPWCDLAKGMMMLAYGGTGLFLSDGATNVMPVGPHRGSQLSAAQERENRAVVHSAWQLAHQHIRHSLIGGFYQGWDLHPAQLPVRYAACYAFFLSGFAQAAERLRAFIDKAAQATLVGDVFDDAATGQGLLNYFLRALNCGAVELDELAQTGLTKEEFALRSFAQILAARRARLAV
jgi:citrate lyase beta subunit